MKHTASYEIKKFGIVFSLLLISLLLLSFSVSARDYCRADFTLKNPAVLDQDISPYIDMLVEKGYSSVTIYGFASVDEDSVKADARANAVARKIADISGGKIDAFPQKGLMDASVDMFGDATDNRRVIVATDQLFHDEYTPAPEPGEFNPDDCPLVLYCSRTKRHKGQWYCMKSEEGEDVWYGPCENERCIGDTEFSLLSSRMQTELDNVVGDDPDSLNDEISELVTQADIFRDNGLVSKALPLYQEALEYSRSLDQEQREISFDDILNSRDGSFRLAMETVDSREEAEVLISIIRRSERMTPLFNLQPSLRQVDMLESLVEPIPESPVKWFVVLCASIIALLVLMHVHLHFKRSHAVDRSNFLDRSAEEIITDIEEMEMCFRKKAFLADDNISKLKNLKTAKAEKEKESDGSKKKKGRRRPRKKRDQDNKNKD